MYNLLNTYDWDVQGEELQVYQLVLQSLTLLVYAVNPHHAVPQIENPWETTQM